MAADCLRVDEPGGGALDDLEAQVRPRHELEHHVQHPLRTEMREQAFLHQEVAQSFQNDQLQFNLLTSIQARITSIWAKTDLVLEVLPVDVNNREREDDDVKVRFMGDRSRTAAVATRSIF